MTQAQTVKLKINGVKPFVKYYIEELNRIFYTIETSGIIEHREDNECHCYIILTGVKE